MWPFRSKKNSLLVQQTFTVTGIVLFCLLLAGIFIYSFDISLLLLAGIVLAVYLRMIADKIKQWTGWKDMLCFALSLLITIVFLGGLFMLIGSKLKQQSDELIQKLPEMKQKVAKSVEGSPLMKKALGKYISGWGDTSTAEKKGPQKASPDSTATNAQADSSSGNRESGTAAAANEKNREQSSSGGGMGGIMQKLFSSTFGLLGDLYAVFFLGVFFAAAPKEYVDGFVKLLPVPSRKKARSVMEEMGFNLKKWFKGTVYSVLITFALTAIGLAALGVELWLILAIMAGLLTFIPNFGPIISLIPAVLVGILQGPQQVLYIAILYFFVQLVESNIITPMIQKRMLQLPAALLLFFQMIMGVLSAGWGVVMATPLLVVIITIVQQLYIGEPKEQEKG